MKEVLADSFDSEEQSVGQNSHHVDRYIAKANIYNQSNRDEGFTRMQTKLLSELVLVKVNTKQSKLVNDDEKLRELKERR